MANDISIISQALPQLAGPGTHDCAQYPWKGAVLKCFIDVGNKKRGVFLQTSNVENNAMQIFAVAKKSSESLAMATV